MNEPYRISTEPHKIIEGIRAWEHEMDLSNKQLSRVLGAVINHKKGERIMGDGSIKWVYISGPYTHGDSVANTHAMTLAWIRLQKRFPSVVFINPLAGSMATHLIEPQVYEFWIKYDLDLIRLLAGAGRGMIYRFNPSAPSSGADRELALGRELGIPILHGSVDDLIDTLARQGIDSPASDPSSDQPLAISPQTREATTSDASQSQKGTERVGSVVRVDFSAGDRREARERLIEAEKIVAPDGGDGMNMDDWHRVKAIRDWIKNLVGRLDD